MSGELVLLVEALESQRVECQFQDGEALEDSLIRLVFRPVPPGEVQAPPSTVL